MNSGRDGEASLLARLARLAPAPADLPQDPLVLATERFHAHVQVEEHAGAEESLELLARRRPDPLDHVAAPADHDRLLRLAVDDDRAIQPEDGLRGIGPLGNLLEAIDDDRARKRDLGVRELEQLFPDDLGREEPLGLIGQEVLRIQPVAVGEPMDEAAFQPVDVVPRRRRDRHDLGELRHPGVLVDHRQQPGFPDQIDLVENQEEDRKRALRKIDHVLVALAMALAGVHHQPEDVHLADRLDRRVDHPSVHPVQRAMDSGRVQEHHLGIRVVPDAENPGARRLGLVRDDGELGPDETIEERRLAGIWPADERYEAGLHRDDSTWEEASCRVILTLFTRRRSASSTSTDRPASTSNRSPTVGTRPRWDIKYPPTVSKPSRSIWTPSR